MRFLIETFVTGVAGIGVRVSRAFWIVYQFAVMMEHVHSVEGLAAKRASKYLAFVVIHVVLDEPFVGLEH